MNTPHAGIYISRWLQENQMSQAQLAGLLGHKEPFISKIVNGKAHVSPKIAVKLEAVTRVSAVTWMQCETEWMLARVRSLVH